MAVINAHLGELEKSFMEATEEKTRVEGQARACKERLGLAERCGRYRSVCPCTPTLLLLRLLPTFVCGCLIMWLSCRNST